jgi:hypothetical protein
MNPEPQKEPNYPSTTLDRVTEINVPLSIQKGPSGIGATEKDAQIRRLALLKAILSNDHIDAQQADYVIRLAEEYEKKYILK